MSYSYSMGARGFVVEGLQERLGLKPDGVYGAVTARAVAHVQQRLGLPVNGRAGAVEFTGVGAEWPSEFERCMNLVCNFEGTSFGDCNETDIDGAGLTMGIAGFTSAHGEVQHLLHRFFETSEDVAEYPVTREFHRLWETKADPLEWKRMFFESGKVVAPRWRQFFAAAGREPLMQRLQLQMAEDQFWKPALAVTQRMGFRSLPSKCFFLDVAVQNGGWRKSHQILAQRMLQWQSSHEPERLTAAAYAVAACAKPQWQADVRARKLAIAKRDGIVHGRRWILRANAVEVCR